MPRSILIVAAGCVIAAAAGLEASSGRDRGGLAGAHGQRPGERAAPPARRQPARITDAPRVAVTLPPGWHTGREQILPLLAPPAAILVVGTFVPRLDPARGCSRAPDFPQVRVGRRQALVILEEQSRGYPWLAPERPQSIRLLRRGRFPWACMNRRGYAGTWFVFGEAGRLLTLTAIVGPEAPPRVRRETVAVAESLRVSRREHGIEATPVVRPSGALRVRLVSGTWTGTRGRMRTVYAAHVRGPERRGCTSRQTAEFAFARAGTRIEAVMMPHGAEDGRWCRGRYGGVIRLHRVLAGERVPPERVGRFEFTVR